MTVIGIEGFGKKFDVEKLNIARQKTWHAVEVISQNIGPGMSEKDAEKMAISTLRKLGARKFWHPVHIRFGKNTIKGYRDDSEPDVYLKKEDIYFIDIGPIFDGHEGDCGKTFAVGSNSAYHELAKKSKTLYDLVREDWQRLGLTGLALWQRAQYHANGMGVDMLPLYVKGHRISDFPHEAISKDKLFDFNQIPNSRCWILEIQIQDRVLGLGSFYEDFL